MNIVQKQTGNYPDSHTPPHPLSPLLLTLHPHLLLFTMPCFLINFCGVWNPLGAISHFSKHPGSFWGSGARRRGAAGRGGPQISISIEGRLRGIWARRAGTLSVQSDGKEKECHRWGSLRGGVGGGTLLARNVLLCRIAIVYFFQQSGTILTLFNLLFVG